MSVKRLLYVFMVAALLSPLFTCRMDAGFAPPTASAGLPADKVLDVARSYSGPFTYETMLPVALNLTVELYEQPSPAAALERQATGGRLIVVSLWNKQGASLYSGSVPSGGTLATVLALPSAPQDVVLRLESPGYEPREVTIAGIVLYSEVNRVMGLLADDLSARAILPDTDQDGVPDIYDVDPLDPESAFKVRSPASGYFTVAFEDLYPVPGDADYNDFVAYYFVEENHSSKPPKEAAETLEEDGNGKPVETFLSDLHGEATAKAKIAGYNHKFGIVIEFPGIKGAQVTRKYYNASGTCITGKPETFDDRAEIWLFENTKYAVDKTATFDIAFPDGTKREMLSISPHDPVLYVRDTGKDIHMVGKDPLDGDPTALAAELSYMDPNGYPWALLVPEDWQHPAETQYIGKAYPLFDEWRASKGAAAPYWYLYPASTSSVSGNNPPAKVSSADSLQLVAGSNLTQEFHLTSVDPDGDSVEFMSSPAPVALQDLFSLETIVDPDTKLPTGLVTFDPKVPEGDYLFYFWSVDGYGASNLATPFKATFSFQKKTSDTLIVIDTFPATQTTNDTYLELYKLIGGQASFMIADDNSSPTGTGFSRIVVQGGLSSGTYFIKVRQVLPPVGSNYGIRVLDYDPGSSYPAAGPANEDETKTWVDDAADDVTGIPFSPWSISLGQVIARSIYLQGIDIDWFKLVLP